MPVFSRTIQLLGADKFAALNRAHVAIFGLGAVGSYVVEALARSGIGQLSLFDHDHISPSNINRQLLAVHSSINRPKAQVARERVLDINPQCHVRAYEQFVNGDNVHSLLGPDVDVVVDAIDGVNSKVNLIVAARSLGLAVVSSMGAAAKMDPSAIKSADIADTSCCPLARIMRKRLRRRGITSGVCCVFSTELAHNTLEAPEEEAWDNGDHGRPREPLGSISYLTGIFGLYVAGEVVRLVLEGQN